ncbi:hypothetical protein [Clostridium estertheticum]|uniref:hypothetical protein n=1 Tax=Clostridium estertheticum TaxID=238834 RepID=UPI001C0CB10A|nr:hypothetical protein [Clostridium estertheticum]MBU3173320.1 hypothetical protein [Clostridium estertheticum]
MDKEEFNKIDLEKQLEYVNKQLKNGESLRNIGKNIRVDPKTIRTRFSGIGYELDKESKQYIKNILSDSRPGKIESEYKQTKVLENNLKINKTIPDLLNNIDNKEKLIDKHEENIHIVPADKKADDIAAKIKNYGENVGSVKSESITNNDPNDKYKKNTNILDDEKILDLLNKYDDIKAVLKWFNEQNNVELKPIELEINVNKLTGGIKTTTVRTYKDVWNNFRKFSDQYKIFKSMDLVSMALIEYMEKYK